MAEGDLQRVLGLRLREIREGRGLSQEEFAELLGFHRTYIGGIERGERNLSLKSVERIAERLGVRSEGLLTGWAAPIAERPLSTSPESVA